MLWCTSPPSSCGKTMGVWEDVGGSLIGNADSSTIAADFARNACRILKRSTLGMISRTFFIIRSRRRSSRTGKIRFTRARSTLVVALVVAARA